MLVNKYLPLRWLCRARSHVWARIGGLSDDVTVFLGGTLVGL